MVFEQIFSLKWIERKEHAFVLGFLYTLIGFLSAWLIFPASFGLMSVAFTSILLIPSLAMLLKMEENVEIRENKFSIKLLFKDHKDIFKVYIFMFLGIFFAYSIITLLIPGVSLQKLFLPQLNAAGIVGFATSSEFIIRLLINNLIVFVACFVLSLVYGAGSILFLTWNASVWGVVFAYSVKQAVGIVGGNPIIEFFFGILPFLPHMITEATAYISAAIVGGVVSKAVLREKVFSKKFHHIITDALILLGVGLVLVLIAGFIEMFAF